METPMMTKYQKLADADREISRLIADGRGLFYIAHLYNVPPMRSGTITLEYLRNQLALQVKSPDAEE